MTVSQCRSIIPLAMITTPNAAKMKPRTRLKVKTRFMDVLDGISTSSAAAESAPHPRARTRTSAHPDRVRRRLLWPSSNFCRRARGNRVCSASRGTRRAWPLPARLPAPTAVVVVDDLADLLDDRPAHRLDGVLSA